MKTLNSILFVVLLVVSSIGACVAPPLSREEAPQASNSPAEPAAQESPAPPKNPLKPVSAFANITDKQARSIAYFEEAGKVLLHPRCVNCHPVEPFPTQGENLRPHVPFMNATQSLHGKPGMDCKTCHQPFTVETAGGSIKSIPGHPHWSLAPLDFAWAGKSLGYICRQLKDPARNGSRTLAMIRIHMDTDGLVGWAWNPGPGREPPPGTQAEFGELIGAWINDGAACPDE